MVGWVAGWDGGRERERVEVKWGVGCALDSQGKEREGEGGREREEWRSRDKIDGEGKEETGVLESAKRKNKREKEER